MARVVYTDENYQTIYVDVNAQHPEVTIGRQQDNMLRIASKAISRHHAKIVFQNGRYIFMDLGSSNGCYVNNTRVTQQEIHPGEKIRCGSIPLDFIDEPRSAAPAAPRPNMPAPGIPQRPNMPQAPAFNGAGPAFVANNMPMNNAPMGPSSMNNSAIGTMATGAVAPSIGNGAPIPPGPLSGNMPSAPSGASIKMGMNAPKLQMFGPGLPSSGSPAAPSSDMRNINIRPITGNGNFRPTMINQPSYDQNMERIAQQSQQQTQPPQMRPGQAGPMLPPLGIGAASPAAPSQSAAPAMPPANSPLPPLAPTPGADPFDEPVPQNLEPGHDEFDDNFNNEFNDHNDDDQFVDDGLASSPNAPVDPNDPLNNFPPENEPDPIDNPDPADNPVDDHFAAAGRPRYNTRDNALGRRAQPRSATGRMDSNVSMTPAASPSSQHPAVANANARRPQNQRGRMTMHNGRLPSMHDDYLDEMAPADNFELQDQTNADFQDDSTAFQDDNRQNVHFDDAENEDVRRVSSQNPACDEIDSIDDLRAKLSDALSDLRSLRHQLDDAEAARMEAEADLEALRDGNNASTEQTHELQNKLDETQSLLDAKIQENERIYALLQEAENARDAALNAAAGGDSAADALNQEMTSLRAQFDETLAELQKTQQALSDAQDAKAETLLSLKDLESQSQNYKNQADQAQFDLANVRANAEAFQAQIAELQKQNDDKDSMIASLRAELDQKNNDLIAAANHDDLDNLNIELAQTKAELNNVSAEFTSVKAALSAANEAKLELQKALDVARSSAANPAVSASSNASADFVKTWAPKFDSVIGYAQNVVSLIDGMTDVDPAAAESIHSMFDVLRLCDKKIKKAAKTLS